MITSFYSYKGGVGRSQLVANLAAYLCHYQNRKVLLIDWDLEAPGLHFYFGKKYKDINTKGLIDLFQEYVDIRRKGIVYETSEQLPKFTEQKHIFNLTQSLESGRIDLIPAGNYFNLTEYKANCINFDWYEFYEIFDGKRYIEYLKQELKKLPYDFIFIDSRTGLNDYSNICNIQIPDVNIAVIAPTEQNIEGCANVLQQIIQSPYISSGLYREPIIVPIYSRVQFGNDSKSNEETIARFENAFGKIIENNTLPYLFSSNKLNTLSIEGFIQTTIINYDTSVSLWENVVFQPHKSTILSNIAEKYIKIANLFLDIYKTVLIQKSIKDQSKELGLQNTQLADISFLHKLIHVEVLNLSSNQISDISFLQNLQNLKILNLSDNQIFDISALQNLQNLQTLHLSNNQISDISPLQNLQNLQTLHLSNNQISDISPLQNLQNLQTLHLSNNQISDILPLQNLQNLQTLHLSNNQISDISVLQNLKDLQEIILGNNPIKDFKALENLTKLSEASSYLFEAKMILVGEPAVGKTSLIEKLRNPDYELKTGSQEELMTRGIAVSQWSFPYTNPKQTETHQDFDGNFTAHVFDFGGQDIMHATHRYFLSKRTVYVLVVDTRKEDTDFYYWLNIIQLFGEASPVFIVLNDRHNIYKDVPKHITEEFADLIGNRIFHVNLQTNEGLADLRDCIKIELQSLPHVGVEKLPKVWIDVRKILNKQWVDTVWDKIKVWKNTKEKKHFLTRQEYLGICESIGITDEKKALNIAETLHTLGAILYFANNHVLVDTLILNKHWATEAVYLVLLDTEIGKNYGRFTHKDLSRIWQDKYAVEKHNALLELMLAFKIAYRVQESQVYIAPQLLSENAPVEHDTLFAKTDTFTHFEYRYPKFMPKGLLSRLIIELNKRIYQHFQWRYGVVLAIHESLVEVTEHNYGNVQAIRMRTKGKEPLRAMSVVFDKFAEIHGEFPALSVEEMIPCNCVECKVAKTPYFYKHETLKKFLEKGKQKIQCQVSAEEVEIQPLLAGFPSFRFDKSELRNHIDRLEMSDFFEKCEAIIETQDKPLFAELQQAYIAGETNFRFYDRLKVLLGKYGK